VVESISQLPDINKSRLAGRLSKAHFDDGRGGLTGVLTTLLPDGRPQSSLVWVATSIRATSSFATRASSVASDVRSPAIPFVTDQGWRRSGRKRVPGEDG
jgi:hypothetical protein